MKLIPLTQGKFAKVDSEDYPFLIRFKWFYSRHKSGNIVHRGYSFRIRGTKKFKIIMIPMSWFIMGGLPHHYIDHINGDSLDNRKKNLRYATRQHNCWNSKGGRAKSGFKGVYPSHCGRLPWNAKIMCNYRVYWLGSFKTKKEAAIAYNKAAKKYFGRFAWLNKIPRKKKKKVRDWCRKRIPISRLG